jgi:hypothetical protein
VVPPQLELSAFDRDTDDEHEDDDDDDDDDDDKTQEESTAQRQSTPPSARFEAPLVSPPPSIDATRLDDSPSLPSQRMSNYWSVVACIDRSTFCIVAYYSATVDAIVAARR